MIDLITMLVKDFVMIENEYSLRKLEDSGEKEEQKKNLMCFHYIR